MQVSQSSKLKNVVYDVRGPVFDEAVRLEQEGRRILRMNLGNPAPFGFEAPDQIVEDIIRQLSAAQGYSDSRGVMPARRAVVHYHANKGVEGIDVDDVWLGNGVSEMISMALQAGSGSQPCTASRGWTRMFTPSTTTRSSCWSSCPSTM